MLYSTRSPVRGFSNRFSLKSSGTSDTRKQTGSATKSQRTPPKNKEPTHLRRSRRLEDRSITKEKERMERSKPKGKRRAKIAQNIRVYEGNKDSKDHLSIFSATAEQEEWLRSNEDIQLEMAKLIKNNRILLNDNIFPHEEASMEVLLAKERSLKLIQAWDEKQIESWSLPALLLQLLNDSRTIDEMLKKQPGYSLSMRDENLSTILETKSDEVIKSSVKNLISIPSEYEVTSDDEKIDIFTDTDDLMPLGIESDDYDSEGDIQFFEELVSNDTPPIPKNESSNFDHHDDLSFPRPPPEPPDVEIFFESDSGVLTTNMVKGISEHDVLMPNIFPTLPTFDLLYPVYDTLHPFSSENEDKVFKPGILSYLLVSHQDKTTSDFSENPMMIYGGDIPLLDVLENVGNKMHKAFPLPVMEFPLPEEVSTASKESSHCQKKRDTTAVKICTATKVKK
nr:hypothetical protein [Tanacetum cinerariifolium]